MLTQEEREQLQNLTIPSVKSPDYAVLTFAVCGVDENACGWGGWMLEGAFETGASKTGILENGDNPLPSVTLQICPNCAGTLFRTDTAKLFDCVGAAELRFAP